MIVPNLLPVKKTYRLTYLAIFILPIGLIGSIYEKEALGQEPQLILDKNISKDNFSWTEPVKITLTVRNVDDVPVNIITLSDHIPSGFLVADPDAAEREGFSIEDETLTQNIPTIEPGVSRTYSYEIKGEEGTGGRMQITLQPAELEYNAENGTPITEPSNLLLVSVQADEEDPVVTFQKTVWLFVATFIFGGLGASIHWVNMNDEEKKQLTNRKQEYYFLLGGVAGIVVFSTFEGLSKLFTNEPLSLTNQNLVVLIGTCLAAGFVPMDIIKNATEKWRKSATAAEAEKQKVEGELANEKKVAKDTEDNLNKTLELGSISADIIEKREEENSRLLKENANLKEGPQT